MKLDRLAKIISLLLLSLSVTHCSSSSEQSGVWRENGVVCMRDTMTEMHLKKMTPTVDALAAKDSSLKLKNETVLSDKQCLKRVYKRNGYKIIIYLVPQGERRQIYTSLTPDIPLEVPAKECLTRAKEDLKNLHALFGLKVMDLHQEKFKWSDDDPDLSPVKWLECTNKKTPQYWNSLATMVHELNHEISNNNCMISAVGQNPMCFKFPEKMPKASIARISRFEAKNPEHRKRLEQIQSLYLDELQQPITALMNEMNAYALTANVQSLVLLNHGPLALIDPKNQTRYAELLPLMQLLVARYFSTLKITEPDLYEQIYKNSELKNSIIALMESSEIIHKEWLARMQSKNVPLHDFEKALWDNYERIKPTVLK